jgi:hypothetical protein
MAIVVVGIFAYRVYSKNSKSSNLQKLFNQNYVFIFKKKTYLDFEKQMIHPTKSKLNLPKYDESEYALTS